MPTVAAAAANQRIHEKLGLKPTPLTKIPSTLKRAVEQGGGVADLDVMAAFHIKPQRLQVQDPVTAKRKLMTSEAVEKLITGVLFDAPRGKGVGVSFARDKNLGLVYAFFVHKNY